MRDDPRRLAAKELANDILRKFRRGYKPSIVMLGKRQRDIIDQYDEWEIVSESYPSYFRSGVRFIRGMRVLYSDAPDETTLIEERAYAWVAVPEASN
jgi:hypothetical protein